PPPPPPPVPRAPLGAPPDDVVAGDASRPFRRREKRDEHVHRRRLARAVRAEEAVDLPWRDAEVDPVDGARALLEHANEALGLDAVAILHDPYASGGPVVRDGRPARPVRAPNRPVRPAPGRAC